MTAIALLNIESDPHIIADVLLSNEVKKIGTSSDTCWLPALGEVSVELGSDISGVHLTRLGRKTIILPNRSGILSFAGYCNEAFEFWSELSNKFKTRESHNPKILIDRAMIEDVLNAMGVKAKKFIMLGVLINEESTHEVIIHNEVTKVPTENFGTCYVAGTGKDLVKDLILKSDRLRSRGKDWPKNYPLSATEDLAEHISSAMLYIESCEGNGKAKGTLIAASSGGFFEWYGIRSATLGQLKTRIDLSITISDQKLIITRAFFIEPKGYIKEAEVVGGQIARIYLSLINLGIKPLIIPIKASLELGLILEFEECWEALIGSTFYAYDEGGAKRQHARLNSQDLEMTFPEPLPIHRMRIFVGKDNDDRICKRFVADQNSAQLSTLEVINGKLNLKISGDVILKTIASVSGTTEGITNNLLL